MTRVEYLKIQTCTLSEELSRHITNQASLTELSSSLREVPVNIGQLSKLRSMSIRGSIGDLSSLTSLSIWNCPKLECLPDSLGRLNLQSLEIQECPLRELGLVSISCPSLETLRLHYNRHLIGIEVPTNTLQIISLVGSPELDALPSFAESAFLREFELKGFYRVKKIQGLEHCTALERLTAETRWEEAGIESLERMERLTSVRLQAFSKSGVESCIQSMKKWPKEEVIVCTRAVSNAATLVNSFAFPNLSVVDSFARLEIKSDPSLKWPSTARCILLCFVVNCESPKTSLQLAYSTENTQGKTLLGNYDRMEVEKGKWLWTAFFTHHSIIYKYFSSNRVHICDQHMKNGEVKKGEVSGVAVTGEEERVWEAFTHLWASLSN